MMASGVRPGITRSVALSMKIPVDRSTGSAPSVGKRPVGPGCRFPGVLFCPSTAAPQQNLGMPTPGSVMMVHPSALTVARPATRQSFGASPLRGDSSKYHKVTFVPGARPAHGHCDRRHGAAGVDDALADPQETPVDHAVESARGVASWLNTKSQQAIGKR